jgi:hypothetical protein
LTPGNLAGDISVIANNSCGSSIAQNLSVATNSIPEQPASIVGLVDICEGTSQNYSVDVVSNADSYTWTLPNGWTGNSTTNSITTTAMTSGIISVTANNNCGSSMAQTIDVVVNTVPDQPSIISGIANTCLGSENTYSVTNDLLASSYTWILPSGWIGTSSTNILTTTVMNSGTISVFASNSCGNSPIQTLDVTVNETPILAGVISGLTTACSASSQVYSVTSVPAASSYTWTLPSGWSGTSSTNSITATIGNAGTISVFASNACGISSTITLDVTVNSAPTQPAAISGLTPVCSGSSQVYSIPIVSGAMSYTWTLPSGWSGNSTINSINTTVGSSGNITVRANNSCGSSAVRTLSVSVNSVPAQPAAISGLASVCEGSSQVYSISTVAGANSYTWTLPSGWSGISTSNSINTNVGISGIVSVKANNSCGSSALRTLNVVVNSLPNVTVTLAENTLSVVPTAGATYQWLDCENSFFPISGATTQTFAPSSNGNYAVKVSKSGCADTSICTEISTVSAETLVQHKFKVYPNPTDGNFVVDFGEFITNASITVFDGKGSIVYEMSQINETIIPIQLDVPVGMYFVKLDSMHESKVVKLIVK